MPRVQPSFQHLQMAKALASYCNDMLQQQKSTAAAVKASFQAFHETCALLACSYCSISQTTYAASIYVDLRQPFHFSTAILSVVGLCLLFCTIRGELANPQICMHACCLCVQPCSGVCMQLAARKHVLLHEGRETDSIVSPGLLQCFFVWTCVDVLSSLQTSIPLTQ